MVLLATFEQFKEVVHKKASVIVGNNPSATVLAVAVLNNEGTEGLLWNLTPAPAIADVLAAFTNAIVIAGLTGAAGAL